MAAATVPSSMGAPGPANAVQAAAGGSSAAAKPDVVLQQLNLPSLRTRALDLQNAIGRIMQSVHTNPSLKWSDVLGQFAMVNVELLNLVEDVKPVLKIYVVYPKTVNAENAPILPIMLSSKLLPEMEAEEACTKEQVLLGVSNLSIQAQTEKLQRQIDMVRTACELAEKVLQESRKAYGFGSRQGLATVATVDKVQAARIAEQEKALRFAANYGDGIQSFLRNLSTILPWAQQL